MFHFLLTLFLCSFTVSTAMPKCPIASKCVALLNADKKCPLFPMLPGTFAPPVGPQGFTLTTLRRGVFHYSDDAYHSLILFGSAGRRLVVIDFPRSQNSITADGTYLLTTAVMQVLAGKTPKRVDMVYSHRHLDHIGSAALFQTFVQDKFPRAKLTVWGTDETKQFIQRQGSDTPVPQPTKIIKEKKQTIPLSKTLKMELSILGGHTNSDVLAYIPHSPGGKGVIHYVDIITAGEAPFIQFTVTIDLGRYLEVHEELLKLDFEFFSTGHGMIGDKNDVKKNMAYTQFVIEAAQQAARELDPAVAGAFFARIADRNDVAYRNGAWALKSVLDLQVASCTKKVIARWACQLSVVDVFAEGHCLSAVLYNFVDQ